MIHIFKSVAAKLWALALGLIVLAGVLVGSLHLLLPWASEYREQLSEDLSQVLGAPVRIARLGARLSGLSPELSLHGVEILDAVSRDVKLRFAEVHLRINLPASLRSGQTQVRRATIVGARLTLVRQLDGRLTLVGLGENQASPTQGVSLTPFLADGRLWLRNSELVWDNRQTGLAPLRFTKVDAQLLNAGRRHQLELRAGIAGAKRGRLNLRADLFGDAASPQHWRGELYARAEGVALQALVAPFLGAGEALAGELDLELWGQLSDGRLRRVDGSLALQNMDMTLDAHTARLFDRLSAGVALQRQTDSLWALSLQQLAWTRDARSRPATDLALRLRHGGGGRLLAGTVGELWLEDLSAWAQAALPGSDVALRLAAMNPRGRLSGLQLRLETQPGEPLQWQLAGALQDLFLEPQGNIPGVHGLDLSFQADQDHGRARIDARDLEVRFSELFRWPLPAQQLTGDLLWRHTPAEGFELNSDEIVLITPDIRTRSRLYLSMPRAGSPFLDLQTDYWDADGSSTGRYLPAGILSKELVDWLDRAIVSGHVPVGSFVFRGPVDAFPFYREQGRFQVLFGVQDTILDYQEGWPRLEEIVAEVQFLNEGLDIELYEGKLLESQVHSARMHLPDMDDSRLLHIAGEVRGPFADAFRVLRETPLAESQARYIKGMRARGRSRVVLDFDIPVQAGEEYRIDGHIRWHKAGLLLDDFDLRLEGLEGRLRFNDHGVFADALQARLWGRPIQVKVNTTLAEGAKPASTRLDVGLQLDTQTLAEAYPHPLWDSLDGSAAAHLELDIEHASQAVVELPMHYRLRSKLRGLAVQLPSPLGKRYAESRTLELAGDLPVGQESLIRAVYGDIAGAFKLGRDAGQELQLDGGEVQCSTGRPLAVGQPGISLSGQLSKVDLAGWQDWWREQASWWDRGPAENGAATSHRVQLAIDELQLPGGGLRDVQLAMLRTPNAWEAEVKAERLSGSIRLPDEPRRVPISVQLEHWNLNLDEWQPDSPVADPADWPDPRRTPGLFLSVEQFKLGDRSLGRLSLKALPSEDGLDIKEASLQGPELELKASGAWRAGKTGQETRLQLEAKSPNFGQALQTLGFTSSISEAPAEVKADLAWAAPPMELSLANLNGELDIHIGQGRVQEVNPGMGRLLGLLNLGALSRRLTLDFSDLFGKGYAFDHIEGRFVLQDGNARADPIRIIGPSADLRITGRTGLVARDYDQQVTVTPEISTALPVAGAIAGGPAVGVALLLAQRIMGNEVNKLSRFQYRVEGPWEKPRIQRVSKQDEEASVRLLQPSAGAQAGEESPADSGVFVH